MSITAADLPKVKRGLVAIVRSINDAIKEPAWSDDERLALIRAASIGICTHCGRVADTCHCQRDD